MCKSLVSAWATWRSANNVKPLSMEQVQANLPPTSQGFDKHRINLRHLPSLLVASHSSTS